MGNTKLFEIQSSDNENRIEVFLIADGESKGLCEMTETHGDITIGRMVHNEKVIKATVLRRIHYRKKFDNINYDNIKMMPSRWKLINGEIQV